MNLYKFLLLLSLLYNLSLSKKCWKRTYGRGAGAPLSACPGNTEKTGALCYPRCKPGYRGVGPVCWPDCPSGYKDTGVHCVKPASYGRGGGYAVWDQGKCGRDHKQGCEKNGLMWYPKCKPGFHAVGCCICSPDCPKGFKDIGASCEKPSYGRGAGLPMICPSNTE